DAAGNRGLGLGGLVEIDDVAHLAAAKQPLKRLFSSFNGSDELRDWVVGVSLGFDGFAFEVKAARELYAAENVPSLERNEIEDPVFLSYSCREHRRTLIAARMGRRLR